jgi:DNA-directed RNA polymerase alpha subunit
VPDKAVPFSTPRAWASLSRALDLVGARGSLTGPLVRALAVGRVSEDDARRFAATWMGTPAESVSLEEKLNWSLAELELSVRAKICLEREGLLKVRDVVTRSDDELLEIRNFGDTQLRELKAKLALHGLALGMTLPG